jgi:hypothetical protein
VEELSPLVVSDALPMNDDLPVWIPPDRFHEKDVLSSIHPGVEAADEE